MEEKKKKGEEKEKEKAKNEKKVNNVENVVENIREVPSMSQTESGDTSSRFTKGPVWVV